MHTGSRAKFLILIFLSSLLFFSYLGKLALIDPDEPRYAESAREMLVLKNYIIPHLNFEPRLDKPVLYYWLILISYRIFGLSEFSARLPSAFFGLILILGMYLLLQQEISEGEAWLSSLILLSTPAIYITSRIAITDIVYTSLIIFALFLFWFSLRNRKLLFGAHFLLGLSIATKGPAGFMLVLLTLLFFCLWERDRSLISRFFNPGGLLVLLLVGGWWYGLLLDKIGWLEFRHLIIQETWGRIQEGFIHKEPFYYYLPLILAGFLPWSIFLPGFGRLNYRNKFIRYLVTFSLTTFIFFSFCKTKLPTYILPLFPPLAVFTAEILSKSWDERRKETGLLFFILIVSSILILLFSPYFSSLTGMTSIVSISRWILILSMPLIFLKRLKFNYQFWYLFSLPFLVYFYLLLSFGEDFSSYRSCKVLFENQKIESERISTLNLFEPSIVFYSRKRVEELKEINSLKKGEYLVVKKENLGRLLDLSISLELISETKKYYLLRLQKLQN